ncbi:T9SS type A sorting domain-containing protein, partial [Sphingobacteriales bacterium CHB3]|nr:T9SS type A sorting domain-containing protein [Sphingobacteriales bacterium CHB3]
MKQAFRLTDSSHLLTPRSVLTVLLMVVAGAACLMAQTPQYYNYQNVGTSSNSFPFGQAAGKKVQWLLLPNDLTQPAPCPPGNSITKVYFFVSTAGTRTYTDFTISMGQTSITTLPTGAWYSGPMQVVKSSPSIALTGVLNSWMSVELDTPFPYDPTQSLVIEVNQCGSSGTGISVRQNALTGFRRSWSGTTTPCPFLWGGQDASIVNFGVDVVPSGIPGWTTQTSGITTALYSVRAVSGSVAWAAGAGGVVLRTTDGGGTWTNVGGGAIGSMDLYNIDALNATTAFVTGTPSTVTYIFRTTNGGTSWDTVFTQSGGFINAIRMFNASNGIAQGDPVTGKWTILQTTDGGTTWARTATEPTQVGTEAGSNNGLEAIGSTHIWFTSNSTPPKVYRTTDGGATWNSGTLPGSATFTAGLAFLNTQIGVAGANNGTAARTTDGGATWNSITVGTTGTIYGMAKAGTLDFWATRGTTIQVSKDRGVIWTQDFSDATSGTIWHINFVTSGNIAKGWTVTGTGKIYAYFNPISVHDLGIQSLAKVFSTNRPAAPINHSTDASQLETAGEASFDGSEPSTGALTITPTGSFSLADTVGFRAIVKNFGTFNESSYELRWQVNGVNQPAINRGPIAADAVDTVTFQWNQAVNGSHTLKAWTVLANDSNPANDTSTISFNVGRVAGDTLYTFVVPNQIILGVAKIGSANKLAFTSGGQSSTIVEDNKWIVTDMYGGILDTSHLQVNPTTGQGFGFRDIAWDGRWLLTSDDTRIRRIDTTTFTEIASPIVTTINPNRGIAYMGPNRIWVSNFTTNPVTLFDTTGATVRTLGVPSVAPYGIAFDRWTSRTRGYLWYSEPSTTGGPVRLSKVDTTTGAILTTFNYSSFTGTGVSGGLTIITDHPAYPNAVIGLLVAQRFPTSLLIAVYLGIDSTTVGVQENGGQLPETFILSQNYPNPFNPSTTISYGLPTASQVSLKIYNVLGQAIATLRDEIQGPGAYSVQWDNQGSSVSSGVYFYRLEAKPVDGSAPYTGFKKMILLK